MSCRLADNDPGLCSVKGEKSGRCRRTRARNQLSNQSLRIDKTPPHYHVLVILSVNTNTLRETCHPLTSQYEKHQRPYLLTSRSKIL
jgi:hypothetical protein